MTDPQLMLALKARDEGIQAVSHSNATFIETVRSAARMICRKNGTVSADDVREWAKQRGIEPTHKNAWGAVFCKSEFEFVCYFRSRQLSGRGNLISRWRLRNQ
jgi:hypothetical protein